MTANDVAITGELGLLAAHVAARAGAEPRARVACVASPPAFERFVRALEAVDSSAVERMRRIDPGELPPGAEIWHFAGPFGRGARVEPLVPFFHRAGARAINYVVTPYAGGERWRWVLPPEHAAAVEPPAALDAFRSVRVFTTSPTVSARAAGPAAREGLLHVLATVFDLRTEMDERCAGYFDYRALRCRIAPDATVSLILAESAAQLMLAIAATVERGRFTIASPREDPLGEVLERIGAAYGLSIVADEEARAPNAVDELFERRLMSEELRALPPDPAGLRESCRIAGMPPDELALDEDAQADLFDAVARLDEEERQAFASRVAGASAALIPTDIPRGHDSLSYYASPGRGPAVVLLNALGQGIEAWRRMIAVLTPRYRVLVWSPRGLDSPDAVGLADHAGDLDAILRHEGIDECRIVAWCTGPKVAVEYCLRRPAAVRAMVFLNTAIKCAGSPPELDTVFEHNFEPLARVLQQRPSMAASVMGSLRSGSGGNGAARIPGGGDDDDDAPAALDAVNVDLREHVLRPFASPEWVLRFAGQVLDFWEYDVREKAAGIRTPVLLVSSEYDAVAAPAATDALAPLFANSRVLHVAGATHYLLYDRADVTGRIIESFFDTADAPERAPDERVPAPAALAAAGGGGGG